VISPVEPQLGAFLECADRLLGLPTISIVVELGARDCSETRAFSERLPQAAIYAFECNPATLPECRAVTRSLPNVTLIEAAATNLEGRISFYATDPDATLTSWANGNPGASSLLRASGKYPVEHYVQSEVEVSATTLGTFCSDRDIDHIDLLWMDIQGSELMALAGAREVLPAISLIHTEVAFVEIYSGQPLFSELHLFLRRAGFRLARFTSDGLYSADAMFVNLRVLGSRRQRAVLIVRDAAVSRFFMARRRLSATMRRH
jgi:FkbM family methyltransferase